jgi:hypothetical protein
MAGSAVGNLTSPAAAGVLCDRLGVGQDLEMTLAQLPVRMAQSQIPPELRWWEMNPAPPARPVPLWARSLQVRSRAVPRPAPAAKPGQEQTVGALSLGLRVVLLIVADVCHVTLLALIGLAAAAWGIWRLVTVRGNNPKPPAQA